MQSDVVGQWWHHNVDTKEEAGRDGDGDGAMLAGTQE